MKDLQFNIVDLVTSGKNQRKSNLINVVLFLLFIGCSAIFIFIFHSKIIPLLLMIPFGIASYFVSKKSKKLRKIGIMNMYENSIELVNEIQKTERKIRVDEVSKIFIRGGVEINSDLMNKKSLFIDISLKSEEVVTVHIGVAELDEITADLVTNFCLGNQIACQRKL